jgi:hypothetical protein
VPRRNRIRDADGPPPLRVGGGPRTEERAGRSWHVQPIAAAQALKPYRCPGCGGVVDEGVAHVVVWRADGVLGDQADLEARRHWHLHCWRSA